MLGVAARVAACGDPERTARYAAVIESLAARVSIVARCFPLAVGVVSGDRGAAIELAGVLASRHHLRPRILPPSVVPASGQQLALGLDDDDDAPTSAEPSARPRRFGWARLLVRVFAIDVTVCRKCGGRMRVLDVVTDPDDIARILHGARAPPRPKPHTPGQVLLFPA